MLYSEILSGIFASPYEKQVFLTNFHFATMHTAGDKESLIFQVPCRLVKVSETSMLYGNEEKAVEFIPPEDATHILYDHSTETTDLILPLMLKVEDDTFSVFLEEGWVKFSYPLSSTGIDLSKSYHL